MNLGQMDFQSLVETMTGMVLVATVALFSYEVFKPPVVYAQGPEAVKKRSAMAPPVAEEGMVESLPAMKQGRRHGVASQVRTQHAKGRYWSVAE